MLLTAGANILLALMTLLTGVFAARLLGPQGRGELAAIRTWPNFLATVAMLGLPEALIYYSAQEPSCSGRYTGSATVLALLSSVPFMVAGYFIMPDVLAAQSPGVIEAARWYLLLIPGNALVNVPFNSLRGCNDLTAWNALRILQNIPWLAVLGLAWLLGRAEAQFVAIAYLFGAIVLMFLPINYVVMRRIRGPFCPQIGHWAQMLRYGLPSVVSSAFQMRTLHLDQMMMVALFPAEMLGLYAVAGAWSTSVHPPLTALGIVLFPQVASQRTSAQRNSTFAQGSRLGVLLSAMLTLVVIALTPVLIRFLFGIEFAPAIRPAIVLIFAEAIAGLNLILEEGMRGLGYPASVIWAEFAGLVVTATALMVLLASLGIMGAALSLLLGYAVVAVFLLVQARRITGHSLVALLCPTKRELSMGWTRIQSLLGEIIPK